MPGRRGWTTTRSSSRADARRATSSASGRRRSDWSGFWRRRAMTDVEQVARDLERARSRTLALTDVDEPELVRQHSRLMSPLVWDLAHVGQQEELWLLREGDPRRQGMLPATIEKLYDAFEHPRHERP